MLSAYIAFLVGYSPDIPLSAIAIVTLGFVAGYLFDRLPSVKKYWQEDRSLLLQLVVIRYVMFVMIASVFMGVGILFARM